MMKINFIAGALLLSLASLLTACQQKATVPQAALSRAVLETSQIKSLTQSQTLTPQALVERLSSAGMVIVGENHREAAHHEIEQWLMTRLAEKRPQGSVLLEMISSDQQAAVDSLRQGLKASPYIREQRIQELLNWNSGWPWPLYRGVVLTALYARYPLLAANLSRAEVSALYQTPQFPPGERSSAPPVIRALSAAIVAMHGGKMERSQLKSMLSIQQNRDRMMAQQLLNAPKPALLIAGSFHAAKNLGVPLHMADLNGPAPVVVILAASGTEVQAEEGDYVWYLPATSP
ncbi:ChaN family lipoprotein [Erwinia sorbitola]|nr:ChaN family lipoprotein [Erwinia sorbitola]